MNNLQEETKKKLVSITDHLLLDTSSKASQISLYNLMNYNRSINMELFSRNIEEYIFYMVAQKVTTSFSAELVNTIIGFSEILIQSQDGLFIPKPEPFDLKFRLKSGEEYWIDILSINDLNRCKNQTIKEHKEKAEKNGKLYRVYLYDDADNQYKEDFLLDGNDFWALTAGFENAKPEIFQLINGAANKISMSSLIKETQTRLLNEWKMQD